jgi:cell wall assembly regulator SMI1
MCGDTSADTDPMEELQGILDELDGWLSAERPGLYGRLRPGLSPAEIRELETRMAPYRLPADLETLYSWHDGWDERAQGEYVSFLPDCYFNSLEAAIDQYTFWCSMIEQDEDIWNPLWFPAFGESHGEFVELQPEPGRPAGPLWSYHSHGGELTTSYASVAALFATTRDLWRAGLLPSGEWSDVYAFIQEHNPATQRPDGPLYREINRFPSLGQWPKTWLVAAGIPVPLPADDAEVVTIAELLADPFCGRPVRGELRGSAGSGDWTTGTLTDETGSVKVGLDRASTENYRLLFSSRRMEMVLTPNTEGETVDEALASLDYDDPAVEAVTGRLLDASAASFHADRIVPLSDDG